jgi:toxin ParE1/3/4
MTRELVLTEPAIADFKQIADYIATQSSLAQAERFIKNINQKFTRIAQFPMLGKSRSDLFPGWRSLSFESYLILYAVSDERIEIARIVSGYRDLRSLFDSDDGS